MTTRKTFNLKNGVDINDFTMLHPNLFILTATVLNFAAERNLPVRITSIIHDRKGVVAKSRTHEQGRALDFSTRGWRVKDCEDLRTIMTLKHQDIGAISASDGVSRPMIYGDSRHIDHFHIQVRK